MARYLGIMYKIRNHLPAETRLQILIIVSYIRIWIIALLYGAMLQNRTSITSSVNKNMELAQSWLGLLTSNIEMGVQAYNFGNFDFNIWVEGEGQDTSRKFQCGFGSVRIILPCEASE